MKIATWNVNSVKARLPRVVEWLKEFQPNVALFQELKCMEDAFPLMELGDLGYNVALSCQKTYNGVAILSKTPMEIEARALPGDALDDHARYIEALVTSPKKGGRPIRVASLYLPNGNPTEDPDFPSAKFAYKLRWFGRLVEHAKTLLKTEDAFVLGGDYNVCPTDDDVYDPQAWRNDALCRPETRAKWRELIYLGLTDALHSLHPEPHQYTFWDYQRGAWQRNNGLRIDHLVLSPQAADRLVAAGIDKGPRGKEKASDHTPVWCELEDQ